MTMKKALFSIGFAAGLVAAFLPPPSAQAGDRVICSFTLPQDAGPQSTAALEACNWGKAQSLFLQCDNPVFYSEKPTASYSTYNQREVTPATSTDVLVDFDLNPDPYRVDLRGQAQHISILSVSTTANVCKVGTVHRNVP